jgi:hypothetical protein
MSFCLHRGVFRVKKRAKESERRPPMPVELPTLSAEELHKYLVRAFRLGNGARYRFATGLCAMEESRLYLELSYPSIQAYAEEEFHLGRTQIAEHLRVGKKLSRLPASTQAFLDGRLSFSGLTCLTRVATPKTEAQWIEFADGTFPPRSPGGGRRFATTRGRTVPASPT